MGDRDIGRMDLESSTSEPNSPDPVLESYFRQQLEKLYADPSQALAASEGTQKDKNDQAIAENAQDRDDEGYEFHLFRRSLLSEPALIGTSSGPQRIALRSPSPADDDPHFVNGGRPDEYYFSGGTSAELAEQYAQAAVSDHDIISGLKTRWRGMVLPWRVTTIKATNFGEVVGLGHESQAQTNKRKRSGKKRRIVNRKRIEAKSVMEALARQSQAEKEIVEREKRTRKNREKKVKQRQKEKLKKANHVQDRV